MQNIQDLLPDIEEKLQRLRAKRQALGDYPRDANACPVCHFPLMDDAHGWVKEYDGHNEHAGHHQRYGYCEVPCPACSGDVQNKVAARKRAELVARLFGGADIPHDARTWTFATFPHDSEKREAMQRVSAFVASHLTGETGQKRGLYLGGAVGRGKTGIAISALKMAMEQGNVGLFVMTTELFKRIRSSFNDKSSDDLLSVITEVPWLVLDDLAVERPTDFVLEELYYIIQKRRQQGLYTIFTSNLSTKDLEAYWRPEGMAAGSLHAGVRVTERIQEYCTGVSVKGRNLRAGGK
jgi:DNA replication protein DnaC